MIKQTEKNLRQELSEATDDLVTAGLTIARLRAANKKLRAKLAEERQDADERLAAWMRSSQTVNVWREAHRQLSEAIGGKAK